MYTEKNISRRMFSSGAIVTNSFTEGFMGLWYLTPLSTIFKIYRSSQFIGGGNRRKHLPDGSVHRCRDRILVGFTTTCAISAYHH
jgi:hypothetical protein